MKKLHNVLKELRKENGLKQKEIAEKIQITERTYSNYETGKREPDIETLIKIADYYKISLDLLTGRYSINTNIKK